MKNNRKQNHRNIGETLEFKTTQPMDTFSFDTPLNLVDVENDSQVLKSLEKYISVSKVTKKIQNPNFAK